MERLSFERSEVHAIRGTHSSFRKDIIWWTNRAQMTLLPLFSRVRSLRISTRKKILARVYMTSMQRDPLKEKGGGIVRPNQLSIGSIFQILAIGSDRSARGRCAIGRNRCSDFPKIKRAPLLCRRVCTRPHRTLPPAPPTPSAPSCFSLPRQIIDTSPATVKQPSKWRVSCGGRALSSPRLI